MEQNNSKLNTIPTAILVAGAMIAGAVFLKDGGEAREATQANSPTGGPPPAAAQEAPRAVSFTLPFRWGDLGQRMVSVGVIDREKFLALYTGDEYTIASRLLDERIDEPVVISDKNAGIMLNLLWAAGLGNKSAILDKGMMMDKRYGGAGAFASTAGWTIADGNPMDHYSRHPLMMLTPEQETLVNRVAKNIYRPCCDNGTHFPDCNHGMAMLGLLELMVGEGKGEQELYDAALAMNRLWFPAQYEAIDRYVAERGIGNTDTKTLLSASFVSASGFRRIVQALETAPAQKGGGSGGCSV